MGLPSHSFPKAYLRKYISIFTKSLWDTPVWTVSYCSGRHSLKTQLMVALHTYRSPRQNLLKKKKRQFHTDLVIISGGIASLLELLNVINESFEYDFKKKCVKCFWNDLQSRASFVLFAIPICCPLILL